MLSFFPRDVLHEILGLIESVSEGFPTYSYFTHFRKNISRRSPHLPLLLGLVPVSHRHLQYQQLQINTTVDKAIFQKLQQTFSGSNTDCSFTMAISNSFLSPLEKNSIAADLG